MKIQLLFLSTLVALACTCMSDARSGDAAREHPPSDAGLIGAQAVGGGDSGQLRSPQSRADSLVGIWQAYLAEWASGWTDAYQFFPDGRFIFNYNQMDCAKRELSYTGDWSVADSVLTVTIRQRRVLVGGESVEAAGSCATETALINAVEETVAQDPPQELQLPLGNIEVISISYINFRTYRYATRWQLRVTIDGTVYWKMKDDPSAY